MMRKNIGSKLALYPTPVTIVGADVKGKANWLLVAHVGIMGHDHIMISCAKPHYTNQGIKENGIVSVNLVDEAILADADYVGCVSGSKEDKSEIFDIERGVLGSPMVAISPLTMECRVEDNYETKGFDNFILKIENTYVKEEYINENNTLNYDKLKPVLFEMPTYQYLKTGDVIGKCTHIREEKRR